MDTCLVRIKHSDYIEAYIIEKVTDEGWLLIEECRDYLNFKTKQEAIDFVLKNKNFELLDEDYYG